MILNTQSECEKKFNFRSYILIVAWSYDLGSKWCLIKKTSIYLNLFFKIKFLAEFNYYYEVNSLEKFVDRLESKTLFKFQNNKINLLKRISASLFVIAKETCIFCCCCRIDL